MRTAIEATTTVQLAHRTNRWELSMWVPDGRHKGTVTYTLHVKDCGLHKDRTLQIQSEDGDDYEVVSKKEFDDIQDKYADMDGVGRYITEDMAVAFGFMPKAAFEYLNLRWEAVNLLVIPTLH